MADIAIGINAAACDELEAWREGLEVPAREIKINLRSLIYAIGELRPSSVIPAMRGVTTRVRGPARRVRRFEGLVTAHLRCVQFSLGVRVERAAPAQGAAVVPHHDVVARAPLMLNYVRGLQRMRPQFVEERFGILDGMSDDVMSGAAAEKQTIATGLGMAADDGVQRTGRQSDVRHGLCAAPQVLVCCRTRCRA